MEDQNNKCTPLYSYADLLKKNRTNYKVDGFDFDVDTFENLIDAFVPKKNIHLILNCDYSKLNQFCMIVYGMNFDETYRILSGIADMFMRQAISGLAKTGNNTALNIAAKHFMGLTDEANKEGINITIINDLDPKEDR